MPLLVERTFARRQCVECHLIGDFQNIQREQDGVLDKLTHLYRSPDIKTIGISLDVPKGLVVKEATGAVAAAGMKPGDRIAAWNGVPVWTFGDVQYRYDKVDRRAKSLEITVDRDGKPVDLTVDAAAAMVVDRPALPAVERGPASRFRGPAADRRRRSKSSA